MKVPLEPLRGFRDLLPPDAPALRRLMEIFREVAELYGYEEVIPPTLERFELFAAKSGEEIRRSMFVFKDKAGREVALRPEATASIARIYLKHLRAKPKPIRLYYIVNCFRYEEPQKARYREFWQAGIELLGLEGKTADIETINVLLDYYSRINMIKKIILKIGNIGIYRRIFAKYNLSEDEQDHILHLMDKSMYDEALDFISKKGLNELAETLEKIWETRNLGIAKEIIETLDKDAAKEIEYLADLAQTLKDLYPATKIETDIAFARGLAYYTGIIYEVKVPGFPVSIAGGGRYDNLIEIYGDEHVPGVGFAIGIDRTLAALKDLDIQVRPREREKATILLLDDDLTTYAITVQRMLAKKGIVSSIILSSRISKTLARIYEQGVRYAVIIGEREAKQQNISIRDLSTRKQVTVNLSDFSRRKSLKELFS